MIINRVWEMPNKWTFEIKSIRYLLEKYKVGEGWADPFCGNSKIAQFRNDLNPENKNAQSHLMALDFLKTFNNSSLNGVVFDPPYSPRQMSECYKSVGIKVNQEMTQGGWSKEKNEISRILNETGICISFGWNSNGVGKKRQFEIIEILLISHGGGHSDTIITIERKLM